MKAAHQRLFYDKVGMFYVSFDADGNVGPDLGDQVRGFGYFHDGSVGSVAVDPFLDFLYVFDTNLAPIVGQQVTLDAGSDALKSERYDLMVDQATLGACDLVARGRIAGEARGWVWIDEAFHPDTEAEAPWPASDLLALAAEAPITWTCWPPGDGVRAGIDRDEDGLLDRDDPFPADPLNGGTDTGTVTRPDPSTPTTGPTDPPARRVTGDAGGCGCGQVPGGPISVGWIGVVLALARRRSGGPLAG